MAGSLDRYRDGRAVAENQDGSPARVAKRELDLRVIRLGPSFAIRFAIATALVVGSVLVDRPAFAWGVLVLFAILAVPLGRARSFIFSFVPYATVWFTFTALRALADETILAQTLSTRVSEFERWLFGGQLPTIRLQDRFFGQYSPPYHLHWYDYFFTGIHWSYFIVPHIAAVLIWHRDPRLFRHFLGAMTILLAVGLAIYFVIPSRPPWNAPEQLDSPSAPNAYRIMTLVGEELGGGVYRASYRVIGESNPWAAMPSIHMAFTFLLVFPAFYFGKRWGYLALAYSALMGYALVYLGEHYVIDVIVGMMIATYGWLAARTWLHRISPVVLPHLPGLAGRHTVAGADGGAAVPR